jgi:tRNA A37 threonylcarbamoyladenosine synthetase subunit TsaC/SUA5/YrdC
MYVSRATREEQQDAKMRWPGYRTTVVPLTDSNPQETIVPSRLTRRLAPRSRRSGKMRWPGYRTTVVPLTAFASLPDSNQM